MKDISIIGISNREPWEPYYCYRECLQSIRRYGYEPIIVGMDGYGGLGSRPRLLKKALLRPDCADMVIFSDLWDVIFFGSPEEIVGRAGINLSRGVVWNAERNCFPCVDLAEEYPESDYSFRYLNSGFAVGMKTAFLAALEEMECDKIPDDHTREDGSRCEPCCQEYWTKQFLFGSVPMALDTQCHIAQTLCGVDPAEVQWDGKQWTNLETGMNPLVMHMNGRKESHIDRVRSAFREFGK